MPLPRFILNDESVRNSHGFFLLNAGGNFERFNANPVMLDNHDGGRLIGKWPTLTVEGSLLIGEPDFDEGTELGKERKGQVDRGYLKGASIGLYIKGAEYRLNAATGEPDLYVTSWEMLEASLTPLPSNAGALTLKIYNAENKPVPEDQIGLYLENIVNLNINRMPINQSTTGAASPAPVSLTAAAQVALGVSEGADSAAVSAAIVALQAKYETEKAEREKLEAAAKERHEKACREMVERACKEGRITADLAAQYQKLAGADYEATKAALEALPAKQSLSARIKEVQGTGVPSERERWDLHAWMKNDMDGLNRLKAESPELYARIAKKI